MKLETQETRKTTQKGNLQDGDEEGSRIIAVQQALVAVRSEREPGGFLEERVQNDETDRLSDVSECTGRRSALLAEFGDELIASL